MEVRREQPVFSKATAGWAKAPNAYR